MTIKDTYIQENKWYITASKLKEFIKSPEQFFLKYIKEEEVPEQTEKKHFKIWTALDDLVSYWENEFYKKYYIDEWLTIEWIKKRLIENWSEEILLKWLTKTDLQDMLYWDLTDKIKLTPADGKQVLWMFNEMKRQKLMKLDWEYIPQKTFIGKYKSLKLKWTLDRYSIEEIRDTKSCANINQFMWEWKNKLWYDVSMSFYWILVNRATKNKPKLILDVIQKTYPYPSRVYEIPQGDIMQILDDTIIPALDALNSMMVAYEKTWKEELWKVRQSDFYKLSSCDMYPIMESAIQEDVEILQ